MDPPKWVLYTYLGGLDSSEQLTESSSFWNEVWASGIGHEKGAGDGLLSCPKLGQSKTTN